MSTRYATSAMLSGNLLENESEALSTALFPRTVGRKKKKEEMKYDSNAAKIKEKRERWIIVRNRVAWASRRERALLSSTFNYLIKSPLDRSPMRRSELLRKLDYP